MPGARVNTSSRVCIACGATLSPQPFFEASDWYLGAVEGTFRYVRCVDCGTVIIALLSLASLAAGERLFSWIGYAPKRSAG